MSHVADSSLPRRFLNRWKERAVSEGFTPAAAGSLNKPRKADRYKNRENQTPPVVSNQPSQLAGIFDKLLTERGWEEPVAIGSVLTRWPDLVGPDIATHCTAESFTDTTLVIRAETTDWATQLNLLRFKLLQHLADKLGEGVVTDIKILSPYQKKWGKGPQWVKGRGPRDTFG